MPVALRIDQVFHHGHIFGRLPENLGEKLEDLHERLIRRGKRLLLCGPHAQPLFLMDKAGFLDRLGRENVCATIDCALRRARELLGPAKT